MATKKSTVPQPSGYYVINVVNAAKALKREWDRNPKEWTTGGIRHAAKYKFVTPRFLILYLMVEQLLEAEKREKRQKKAEGSPKAKKKSKPKLRLVVRNE
jgi:hypothetical protein